MCIIIAKDKYGRLPSEEELKNSFEFNSDGAGFMYVKNGKVVIDKGYMNYDSFIKHYRKLLEENHNFKGKSLVIHCRIGTSGQKIKGNTHPYPITDNERLLRSKHLSNLDIGIVHNGIIKGYGTATGLNDTQEFISKYIYPLYSHYKDFYKNKDIMYGLELITNSKLAILDSTDTIYYVGDFIDDNCLKFSNDTYKPYTYKYSYAYDYGDDDYYETWYKYFYNKEKKEEKEEKEIKKENLIMLEKNWWIDFYGNGITTEVGDREYWYDYDTLELYEWTDGGLSLVAVNPIIYDEKYEEIW
jgi:predicted glutamine amidotransferase